MKNTKTFWLNVVLASYFAVAGSLSFYFQIDEHFLGREALQATVYSCLVAYPLVTALSLKWGGCRRLNLLARFANWAAIGCCVLYCAQIIYRDRDAHLVGCLATFVFFVLPALINLRALRVELNPKQIHHSI